MLKKIFKLIILIFVFSLFTNVYAKEYVKVNENSNKTYSIVDEKEILSEEQVNEILNKMVPLSNNGNVLVEILGEEIEWEEFVPVSKKFFDNWKKDDNNLLVYVNVKNDVEPKKYNNIYIVCNGFPYSDAQLMKVVWLVTPTLRSGDVAGTINKTFDTIYNPKEENDTVTKTPENFDNSDENVSNTVINESFSKYKLVIEDDANLLSEEEKIKLMDDMTPLTEYGHIIFKSINTNPYGNTYKYGKNYYYNNFQNENGTLLLIDMSQREVYIISGGDNYKTITTAKSEIITDNIYRYLSAGNYYEGASQAYYQMNQLLKGYKIAEPMRYASNIVISLVLAFFINFVIIMITCSPKKSKLNKDALDMAVTVNSFKAEKNGTHRVYSPVSESSGSSGGHSGGGHSGGGFSGGGGGHRF